MKIVKIGLNSLLLIFVFMIFALTLLGLSPALIFRWANQLVDL